MFGINKKDYYPNGKYWIPTTEYKWKYFLNNMFFIVDNDTLKYSFNAKDYYNTNLSNITIKSFMYRDNIFVLYTSDFSFYYSYDGCEWNLCNIDKITSVSNFNYKKWLFKQDSTTWYYSDNGIDWYKIVPPGSDYILAYNNGIFVSVYNGNQDLFYSTNKGSNWISVSVKWFPYNKNIDIIKNNFIITSTAGNLYSKNGKDWSWCSGGISNLYYNSLDWPIIYAFNTMNQNKTSYSKDGGITWVYITNTKSNTSTPISAIDGKYYVRSGAIYYAENDMNYIQVSGLSNNVGRIKKYNNTIFAWDDSSSDSLYYSKDGINFLKIPTNFRIADMISNGELLLIKTNIGYLYSRFCK